VAEGCRRVCKHTSFCWCITSWRVAKDVAAAEGKWAVIEGWWCARSPRWNYRPVGWRFDFVVY